MSEHAPQGRDGPHSGRQPRVTRHRTGRAPDAAPARERKPMWPAPWLSLCMVLLWLALNPPPTRGTVAFAVLLAWFLPRLALRVVPVRSTLSSPLGLLRLLGITLLHIFPSAFDLARRIVFARRWPLRSQFVFVPIELTDPYALAVLQLVTTTVPGTVWCEWRSEERRLLLHVADVVDADAFIVHYKANYEQPLLRIFR